MKTYITRINGWSLQDKNHYMQHMVAEIAHQLGCREMGIYRYFAENESNESLSSRVDGIIAGINRGDIVICQFPTGDGMRFENALVGHLKAYGGRIAILIHEMEALSYKEKQSQLSGIIGLYNQAEVLIVPTYAMRQWLLENGIRKSMKFVVQEMWDYIVGEPVVNVPAFKKEIYFTDSYGFAGMNDWNYAVPLKLYNVSANQGRNVQNLGGREPYQLFYELSFGGFGLVWYRDEYFRKYMEYSASFSLARYLAAGIPVIVPEGIAHQTMVEENHLGLVVNSIQEAASVVESMKESEYQEYVQGVAQFAPALRNGYYTKKCLIEAMQAFYRKDAGRIPIPNRIYEVKKNVFKSVVLKESYGGNLALSWDFQGEADGFLIYDLCGTLLENIQDIYQHYVVLRGQEKEVLIKAYVETLKGTLILAESEPVYLQERHYGKPKVTIIIPAYNAETHIARCIDTVLAQSQPDVEILVVDDGSIDCTPKIIDWYCKKYENIVVKHQKNGGAAVARNTGITYANGEYIGFVDADDLIYPSMVERLYRSAKKNGCDIAITSIYMLTENERTKDLNYPIKEDAPITVDDFFSTYCYWQGLGAVVWNKLYCSTLAKKHMIPVMPYEDEAWTPYILSYADKVCYLNDFSYEWDRRNQDSSLSLCLSRRSEEEQVADIRKAILYFLENGKSERIGQLKKIARTKIGLLEDVYHYKGYVKLRNEIEENY